MWWEKEPRLSDKFVKQKGITRFINVNIKSDPSTNFVALGLIQNLIITLINSFDPISNSLY